MISLTHRFHGHNSLRQTYQKGKPAYSANFKIISMAASGKTYRVAVVVSKKVHKSAVVRNRIRRRTYEQVRLFMGDKTISADIILIAQNDQPAKCTSSQLQSELLPLLKKTLSVS